MSHDQHSSSTNVGQDDDFRDIHALSPPSPALVTAGAPHHHRSPSLSAASDSTSSENFTTMSREFNALVLAGSAMEGRAGTGEGAPAGVNLEGIGEDREVREVEETNPLAIVLDVSAQLNRQASSPVRRSSLGAGEGLTVHGVKKEEVESKISAWQTAKVAKINNRFKREDAIISGWESEEVQKASTWMKKVERKLEEKRARAVEKMQNDIAKARRKAEEKRASAEAKRGTKVARVMELANLMKVVGRAPTKRSFF